MTRYNPTEGDTLIENNRGRKVTHEVTDVDGRRVTYTRPDGVTVTKLVTSLRQDLLRGDLAVKEEAA